MSFYENSMLEIIERVGRLGLDEWYEGTATGGSTTTVVDTGRYESDDFFNSLTPPAKIRITSTTDGAAPQGEERYVTDWVQSTGTATVHSAFTVAPAAGDKYIITSKYYWEDLVEAVNAALQMVDTEPLADKVDETVELVSAVYEYPVPAGFVYIYAISMADGSGNFSDRIPPDQYRIVKAQPGSMIHFIRLPGTMKLDDQYVSEMWADNDIVNGRLLRIEGFGKHDKLVLANDVCRINPEYTWRQAAAILRRKRIRAAQNDQDDQRTQYNLLQSEANIERGMMMPQRPPNLKRVWQ